MISHLCEKRGDSEDSDKECNEQSVGGWLWGVIASLTMMTVRMVMMVMMEKVMPMVEGGDG